MSVADKNKWDAKYQMGAYAQRRHPSVLLQEYVEDGPRGKALDLACGAGRNSVSLATRGFEVTAVDISSVGLEQAQQQAKEQGVNISWVQMDLLADDSLSRISETLCEEWQLIVMTRFKAIDVLMECCKFLAPGGMVIGEAHLVWDDPVGGPSARFRVQPNEVLQAIDSNPHLGLEIVHHFEGLVDDPDGETMALSQIVAKKRLV